jgi:hypothetical protein
MSLTEEQRAAEALPTVDDIITALAVPGTVEQCYHIHPNKPPERLPEVWIEHLGVWLREDGSAYSGDLGRGHAYPNRRDRDRLREAVRAKEADDATD